MLTVGKKSNSAHIRAEKTEDSKKFFKKYHDNSVIAQEFRESILVYAKNFYTGPRWKGGVGKRQTGPVSYEDH